MEFVAHLYSLPCLQSILNIKNCIENFIVTSFSIFNKICYYKYALNQFFLFLLRYCSYLQYNIQQQSNCFKGLYTDHFFIHIKMFHKFRKNIEVSIETISLGSNVSAFAEFLIELVSINGTDDGYFTSNVLTKISHNF